MSTRARYRIAVDVGGTFIDFVALDEETGALIVEKTPSLAEDLPAQFLKGLGALGIELGGIHQIFHGMTVGVNALVQERGAKVGLITTRGFRDVLEIGRGGREPVYNFVHRPPTPLVERRFRREVSERVTFQGQILQPLDEAELDREVDDLLARGVQAIAICFLHAYAQPAHERLARQRILARHPGLPVCVSHEIAAEWREYERTSTTVLNAFIQPVVRTYLEQVRQKLQQAGYRHPLGVMQSNGGVVDAGTACDKPIRTLMSGPAGGVMGARHLCDRLGYRNVICTDVGGTTYDVAIIEDGKVLERSQTEIAQRPILGSLIDVTSIGAGGGSIAWLDHRNALQVGPRSAGASPGPVCFSRGGEEPTVTDAHLVLGCLDPEYFLGGRMKLSRDAARRAIAAKIADPLGMGVIAAARGIIAIAETNMANAIRTKTVERGLDPREFVLLAYGGGGGLFACAVAAELGVRRVVIPNAPANFSAWGILGTDYMEDEVRTKVMPLEAARIAEVLEVLAELEASASRAIAGYGFVAGDIDRMRRLDVRFRNQEYTLTIDVERSWNDPAQVLDGVRKRFVEAHRRLYGHGDPEGDLEVVSIRCRATGHVQAPPVAIMNVSADPHTAARRSVHLAEGKDESMVEIWRRESLVPGWAAQGPAIIEEPTMTTLVPPEWKVSCDSYGNLLVEPFAA
jgi:N-methylhydantoinase A